MVRLVVLYLLCSFFSSGAQSQQTLRERSIEKSKYLSSVSRNPPGKNEKNIAFAYLPVFPDESIPVIVIEDLPGTPLFIMGKGESRAEQLALFLLNENKNADREFAVKLAVYYVAEADTEGINHDVAFAQMCLETGFLRYGGLVIPAMNNFCGLGSIGPDQKGEWFPSVELGVRAHIQHLKAYASESPLIGELVDPRYRFVRRGCSPVLQGLSGTWAADKLYADKIEIILSRLSRFTGEEKPIP